MPGKTQTKVPYASEAQLFEMEGEMGRTWPRSIDVVLKQLARYEVLSVEALTYRQAAGLLKQLKGM